MKYEIFIEIIRALTLYDKIPKTNRICVYIFKKGVLNYSGSNPNPPKGELQVCWDCSCRAGAELDLSQSVVPRPATSTLRSAVRNADTQAPPQN